MHREDHDVPVLVLAVQEDEDQEAALPAADLQGDDHDLLGDDPALPDDAPDLQDDAADLQDDGVDRSLDHLRDSLTRFHKVQTRDGLFLKLRLRGRSRRHLQLKVL